VALAVSWDFFSGSTKYISLGSAAFFGIGLYTTAGLIEVLPLPVLVPLAALVSFGLALAVGLVTLRLRGIYFVILTFAFAIVVQNLIAAWEILVSHTRGTYIDIFFDSILVYWAVFIGLILVLLFTTLFRRSKFGLGLRMIGESEEAAVHVGVNASMHKTLGFAVSAMLMGLMGSLFTIRYSYLNTDVAFDSMWSFMPAVMVLFGGIGTVYGPIIGAIILSLLRSFLGAAFAHYFLIILGIILVAVVILMPNGIMGLPEQIRARSRRRSREKLPGTKKKKAS
jgi:branched-chain amino acid transport system permease protein